MWNVKRNPLLSFARVSACLWHVYVWCHVCVLIYESKLVWHFLTMAPPPPPLTGSSAGRDSKIRTLYFTCSTFSVYNWWKKNLTSWKKYKTLLHVMTTKLIISPNHPAHDCEWRLRSRDKSISTIKRVTLVRLECLWKIPAFNLEKFRSLPAWPYCKKNPISPNSASLLGEKKMIYFVCQKQSLILKSEQPNVGGFFMG